MSRQIDKAEQTELFCFILFHMPKIPATRKLLLKRPDQDKIQWTLTNHNEKRKHYKGPIESPTSTVITTVDIAKKFIKLVYNTNDVRSRFK